MKIIFKTCSRHKNVVKYLFAIMLVISASNIQAQSSNKLKEGNDVTISYQGIAEGQRLVHVKIDNPKGDTYLVEIEDQDYVYHKEYYRGTEYSKTFKVSVHENVVFVVKNVTTPSRGTKATLTTRQEDRTYMNVTKGTFY